MLKTIQRKETEMKQAMKWMGMGMAALLATAAWGAVKPTVESQSLPAIWTEAGAQARLSATRVAELDASRLLAERIYGVLLSSASDVNNFVLDGEEITGALTRVLKGVKTTEAAEYLDDGRVQVVRAVKLREVMETITREVTQQKQFGRWITVNEAERVARENRDTVFDVMGNGALPGSQGMRRIQAKRAAEMDAYRKLAERVMGVSLTARTTVRDFVLESDSIRARLISQTIKGAKTTGIRYFGDDDCEVTMELKIADIYEVVKRTQRGSTQVEEISRTHDTTVLTATGVGAAGEPARQDAVSAATQASGPEVREIETVVRRLIGTEIVVD
jgi:hypothetical protein